ncbi:MAG: AtpZ/AtpI family protein [Clostridia bacterium]|nr:AtpZ/AtpI family protein [Clostridia bacterium]
MSNNRFSIYKGLALITHIGLQMIIPILGAVFLGHYIDERIQTGNIFLIIFIICGVIIGFLNVYKIVMQDIKKSSKKK